MRPNRTAAEAAGWETELKLDFTGLLGSTQVLRAGATPESGRN